MKTEMRGGCTNPTATFLLVFAARTLRETLHQEDKLKGSLTSKRAIYEDHRLAGALSHKLTGEASNNLPTLFHLKV